MTMQPDQASVPASIPQPDQFPAFFRQVPVLLMREQCCPADALKKVPPGHPMPPCPG